MAIHPVFYWKHLQMALAALRPFRLLRLVPQLQPIMGSL
jgi:hypothetical protein